MMPPAMRRQTLPRWVGTLIFLALLAAGAWVLWGTQLGADIRQRDLLRRWTLNDPIVATLTFILMYGLVGFFALPVWWMQLIAGYCFGLVMGVIWCQLGAIIAAAASLGLARWLLGEWARDRAGPYQKRFASLRRKVGQNGLLVVAATRICHVMPFGISNYLFALGGIGLWDVIVGTILGGTLSKMIHVAAGKDLHLLADPRFLAVLGAINLALLSPLIVRYIGSWIVNRESRIAAREA